MPAETKPEAEQAEQAGEISRLRDEVSSLRQRVSDLEAQLASAEEDALRELALREERERELTQAQAAMVSMREQIRLRPLAPNAKEGAPVFFALMQISNSGRPIMPGDPLPFDPYNPPKGFDGFIEGTHFRRG